MRSCGVLMRSWGAIGEVYLCDHGRALCNRGALLCHHEALLHDGGTLVLSRDDIMWRKSLLCNCSGFVM